ncbi:acyltransferase [Flavobacterium sp.]|uniref:acyltransferase n=1 Tax=Flavobacterium sp. TaxID=239 RepID=UPI00121D9BE8|nr:acyltransferase [Flavobacterium sp.]RZJ71970.1 MAG: acyltransferase [Flavobacterium sp.]
MLKGLFQRLLVKSGKDYQIDPDLPDSLIFRTLTKRTIMLLRGLLFLRRKVFVGCDCSFQNKSKIKFGKSVTIESHVKIDGYAKEGVQLGNGVKIGSYSWVSCTSHFSKYGKGLKIGNNSAVGQFTEFGAAGGIEIGNDVIMGSYISFHSENHNFEDTSKPIREQGVTSKGIKLGNNIWVGAKVTFLDGCEVGDNSVVAAGAVVTGIYPANSVIGGIPAKVLKTIS